MALGFTPYFVRGDPEPQPAHSGSRRRARNARELRTPAHQAWGRGGSPSSGGCGPSPGGSSGWVGERWQRAAAGRAQLLVVAPAAELARVGPEVPGPERELDRRPHRDQGPLEALQLR